LAWPEEGSPPAEQNSYGTTMGLLCLLVLPTASALADQTPAVTRAMAAAERHLTAGALDAAQEAAEEAVRLARQTGDPELEAAGLNLRGLVTSHQLDPAAAASDWHAALKLTTQPDLRAAIVDNRAADLSRRGRHGEALALLQRALGELPQQSALWLRQGEVLMAMHRPHDALPALDRAAELQPAAPSPPAAAEPRRRLCTLGVEAALGVGDPAATLRWVERGHVSEALSASGHSRLSPDGQRALLRSLAAVEAAPLAGARALLAALPASLLIEYYLGPRRVALVAVSPTEACVAEVPLTPGEFATLATRFRDEVSAGRVAPDHAELLASQLLAPCYRLLPARSSPPPQVLIIGPDPVRGLPFGVLFRFVEREARPRTGPKILTAASLASEMASGPAMRPEQTPKPGTQAHKAPRGSLLSMMLLAGLAASAGYVALRSWKSRAAA